MTWHPLEDIEDDASETGLRGWHDWQRNQRDNREPAARWRVLGSGRCWCGQALNHDWPGKADGGPHPRVAPDGLGPISSSPEPVRQCGAAHRRQAIRRPAAIPSRRHLS